MFKQLTVPIVSVLVIAHTASADLRWVDRNSAAGLDNRVIAGIELNQTLYICRANTRFGPRTGKTWRPGGRPPEQCNIKLTKEEPYKDYQVLVGTTHKWVGSHDTGYPKFAFIAVRDAGDGVMHFVCQARGADGASIPGHLPDNDGCSYGQGGSGARVDSYLVLVTTDPKDDRHTRGRKPEADIGDWLTDILNIISGFFIFCGLSEACATSDELAQFEPI